MNIRTNNEWLHWGDDPLNFIGFFAPIEEAHETNGSIVVKNKYGEYHVNIETCKVVTLKGVEYYVLTEVAGYGAGYKYWETSKGE